MSMQDPIADMFLRIKNAQSMEKEAVTMPSSRLKVNIAKVLLSEGYIADFQVEGELKPTLIIYLKYYQGRPVIEMLKRVSRVGCRIYQQVRAVPKVMDGFGTVILSTSKGVVSGRVAHTLGQGGEVLGLVA